MYKKEIYMITEGIFSNFFVCNAEKKDWCTTFSDDYLTILHVGIDKTIMAKTSLLHYLNFLHTRKLHFLQHSEDNLAKTFSIQEKM